jgi:hypothetical protein
MLLAVTSLMQHCGQTGEINFGLVNSTVGLETTERKMDSTLHHHETKWRIANINSL